jgi:hypothetical protein
LEFVMKLKTLALTSLVASAVSVLAAAGVSFAGTCSVPHGCVSSGLSGTGQVRDFATNDWNLTDNYYDNGSVVNDNVLSIRIPSGTSGYMCAYQNVGYPNSSRTGWTSYAYSWRDGQVGAGMSALALGNTSVC